MSIIKRGFTRHIKKFVCCILVFSLFVCAPPAGWFTFGTFSAGRFVRAEEGIGDSDEDSVFNDSSNKDEDSGQDSSESERNEEAINGDRDNSSEDVQEKSREQTEDESKVEKRRQQNKNSGELTNDFIKDSENKKNEVEQNKKNVQGKLSQVKAMLNQVKDIKSALDIAMVEADAKLEDLTNSIEILTADIEDLEIQIDDTQNDLEAAKRVEAEQYSQMKKRVKFMYEKGNKSYFEMLFEAGSFSDFLNQAEFVNKISKYDKEKLDEYIAIKNAISEKERELEQEQKELEKKYADLINQQEEVEIEMDEKQQEIDKYTADINNKEQAIKEYEEYIAEQEAVARELEAAILAEKKRLLEENKEAICYDGGQFAWPAPDYKRISDEYGYRTHPTLGVRQFHNGVDLASPNGSRILAAYDGEVVAAAYSATMGNYVMINHGDGLLTIYMHASALLVSEGQLVVKGEQIAKVGSTGRSTGPHLHFSVRKDGSYVSPWNYIS